MKQIEKRKKSAYMKIPKELADQIKIEVGSDGIDAVYGLQTIRATLSIALAKTNETLEIHFNHEIPLTWADYMRKAKGMPYKSETVSFHKMFEIEYKNIFPNAPEDSYFEADAWPIKDT